MNAEQLAKHDKWLKGKQLWIIEQRGEFKSIAYIGNLILSEEGVLYHLTASGEYKTLPYDFSEEELVSLLKGKKVKRANSASTMAFYIKKPIQ